MYGTIGSRYLYQNVQNFYKSTCMHLSQILSRITVGFIDTMNNKIIIII